MTDGLPTGVVVPFARTHKAMEDAWPGACIRANSSGSVSAALFAEFVETCWLAPMRAHVPLEQELVLICDSGGGCWLHVSPELCITLERNNCRMFLLPPYSTKGLCALDQIPHLCWAQEWARVKRQWSAKRGTMTICQALLACSKISMLALTEEKAAQAYRSCGLEVGMPLNRSKLLVERSQEIFGNVKAHGDEVPHLASQNKKAFDVVSTISPPRTKCKECGKKLEVTAKFCSECGAENGSFDETLHGVMSSQRKSGWQKNMEWAAKRKPETSSEVELSDKVGDFLRKVRQRRATPAVPPQPEPEEPKASGEPVVRAAGSRFRRSGSAATSCRSRSGASA